MAARERALEPGEGAGAGLPAGALSEPGSAPVDDVLPGDPPVAVPGRALERAFEIF